MCQLNGYFFVVCRLTSENGGFGGRSQSDVTYSLLRRGTAVLARTLSQNRSKVSGLNILTWYGRCNATSLYGTIIDTVPVFRLRTLAISRRVCSQFSRCSNSAWARISSTLSVAQGQGRTPRSRVMSMPGPGNWSTFTQPGSVALPQPRFSRRPESTVIHLWLLRGAFQDRWPCAITVAVVMRVQCIPLRLRHPQISRRL